MFVARNNLNCACHAHYISIEEKHFKCISYIIAFEIINLLILGPIKGILTKPRYILFTNIL